MNRPHLPPASDAKPRLACRVLRQWCALSDQRQPDHAATCASCRKYFAALQGLDALLHRDETTSGLPTPSRDFEQEILRAVRHAADDRVRVAPAASSRGWMLGGGLTAAAALALAVFLVSFKSRVDPALSPAPSAADGAAVIASAVQTLSTGLVDSVIPSAGELVADNPLQQELGFVYSDVQSALDFLALNFLPTSTPQPPPVRARQI